MSFLHWKNAVATLSNFTSKMQKYGSGHSGQGGHSKIEICAQNCMFSGYATERGLKFMQNFRFYYDHYDQEKNMNILELAWEVGLQPKRVAATKGGEYHSPCPGCAGRDRFIIWSAINRYSCRRCEAEGDLIQFCRDFMGLGYKEACRKVGVYPKPSARLREVVKPLFKPVLASLPSNQWQDKATDFVHMCQQNLRPGSVQLLHERGFSDLTIQKTGLGWNSWNRSLIRMEWGLPSIIDEQGKEKGLWLPSGIVIPTFSAGKVIKIKIRRHQWKEGDHLPKYVEITGSMKSPSLFGVHEKVIVIVEAELDALLIQQEAEDLCSCMALGGASKRPDKASHEALQRAPLILVCSGF